MGAAVLLLSDDLLDTSRIAAAGREHGLTVKRARDLDGLATLARAESPRLIIVDLANPRLSAGSVMQLLSTTGPAMPRVVAYGPHVSAAVLRSARQAGCDLVLPRSAFFEQLQPGLPEWLTAAPARADSPSIPDREE
jgi:CheY-like chemotaxis protein